MNADPMNIESLLQPVVEDLGYQLWGIELFRSTGRARLRVFIDHQQGVSLDDCARVSHQVSGVLDVEDPIKSEYILEVSSPGVERPLLKEAHFVKAQDKDIKLRLAWPIAGRRNYQGRVKQVAQGSVFLQVNESDLVEIPLNAIKRANMMYVHQVAN